MDLQDLPASVLTEEEADRSGIQFFTEVEIGMSRHSLMCDGGSGVNSTTEELVVQLINENSAVGITMGDPRHPIRQLGKWKHTESLRGVAGGSSTSESHDVLCTLSH